MEYKNVKQIDNEQVDNIIKEIVKGKYGEPRDIKRNLGEILYDIVEKRFIEIYEDKTIDELAYEVLDSKYGNGIERILKLEIMYPIVQSRVNEELGYDKRFELNEKHIEILANRVIQGEFDNGMERKNKLEKLGIDFRRVQNKVNEITGNKKRYNLNLLYIDEYIKKLHTKEITDDKVEKDVGNQLYNFIKNKVNEMNNNNFRNIITKECIDILAEKVIMLEFSENEERKEKLGELYPFVQNKVNEKLGSNKRHDTSIKPWYLKLN